MNKFTYYIFTAISFAFLIAAPGRLAFGIIICLELFFLIFFGFLFSFVTKKVNLHDMNPVITAIGLVFSTILYKQLVMCFFPLIALQMSFVFYLPAATSYIVGIVFKNVNTSTKLSLIQNIKIVSIFSVFAIIFYLIRDIFGYGTLTFPSSSGLVEKTLFDINSFSWGIFFASIPGALVLVSVSILIFVFVQNKFKIIERVIN